MKNGFTLVELLAVIVILSIILLITVPMVLNVIKDSKESTKKESIELYGRSIENAVANYFVKYPEEDYVSFEKLEKENLIEYKGKKVECEKVYIVDRNVYLKGCTVGGKDVDIVYGTKIKNMLIDDTKKQVPSIKSDYTFLNTNVKSSKIKTFNINTNGINIPNGYDHIIKMKV